MAFHLDLSITVLTAVRLNEPVYGPRLLTARVLTLVGQIGVL